MRRGVALGVGGGSGAAAVDGMLLSKASGDTRRVLKEPEAPRLVQAYGSGRRRGARVLATPGRRCAFGGCSGRRQGPGRLRVVGRHNENV